MASAALADIWDAPVIQSPRRSSPPPIHVDDDITNRPSKRPKSSLFLESDDEDEAPRQATRKSVPSSANRSEIDAMFDALDEEPDDIFQDLPPSLDIEALRRQEDAKNAKALAKASPLDLYTSQKAGEGGADSKGSKDTTEKEKRKPLPKLDEARLLGPDGFPALVKQAKTFKPRGKGHEASDLNSLLQVYQFWTHKMYPKTQFRDTVQRVEKLCHSKRMHVALSVWRDESKGFVNGRKIDASSESDNGSDDENNDRENAKLPAGVQGATDAETASSSRAPSQPPSSPSVAPSSDAYDEFDIDAIIREEEEQQRTATAARSLSPPDTTTNYRSKAIPETNDIATDDDEAMWDELMGGLPDAALPPPEPLKNIPSIPPPSTSRSDADEDEDMWDVVREMEAADSSNHIKIVPSDSAPGESSSTVSTDRPTNEEGWDEMYL